MGYFIPLSDAGLFQLVPSFLVPYSDHPLEPKFGKNILDSPSPICLDALMMNEQEQFPKTLQEAIVYFANPDNALAFMVMLRWPQGSPVCPLCASTESSFISTRRVWKCLGCKKQYTVKLGTIMEDSPIKLDKWLTAIWMIVNAKNGISSYEIGRAIGVTQKSAWFLLHRIRLAMQEGSLDKMSGQIEADEAFIRGKARNMHAHKRAAVIQGRGSNVGVRSEHSPSRIELGQ